MKLINKFPFIIFSVFGLPFKIYGDTNSNNVQKGYIAGKTGGGQAVAHGEGTYANGQSVAIGNNTGATGWGAIAIGGDDIKTYHDNDKTITPKFLQDLIGKEKVYGFPNPGPKFNPTWARGIGSVSIGARATAVDDLSTALGAASIARGEKSFALGARAYSDGTNTITIGESDIHSNFSMSIGINNTVASEDERDKYEKIAIFGNQNVIKSGGNSVVIGYNNKFKKLTDSFILSNDINMENEEVTNAITIGKNSKVINDSLSIGNETNKRKIKFVDGGEISDSSYDAINAIQLNDLASKLGVEVNTGKSGFNDLTFAKIKDSSGNDSTSNNTTLKSVTDELITTVNRGIQYGADSGSATQYLGSKLEIKSGSVDTEFVGTNLKTKYDNGVISIGLKNNPQFGDITANKISGLSDPTQANEATNKSYVDTKFNSSVENVVGDNTSINVATSDRTGMGKQFTVSIKDGGVTLDKLENSVKTKIQNMPENVNDELNKKLNSSEFNETNVTSKVTKGNLTSGSSEYLIVETGESKLIGGNATIKLTDKFTNAINKVDKKIKFKGDEASSAEYLVGLDETANFKGNDDIKVKSDNSGVSIVLQKSSNIDTDAEKVVTGQAVKSFVEGKNYADNNLSNLTETGKGQITGLIDVTSNDIEVSNNIDANKKKTYTLKLKEDKIKELAGTTDLASEYAKVDASNIQKSDWLTALNVYEKQEVDNKLNGEITSSETKMVSGKKAFEAIKNSRTTVNVDNQDILTITGGNESEISGKQYTLSLNKDKLSEYIKTVLPNGKLKFKGNEASSVEYSVGLDETANFKGDDDIKVKSDASGVSIVLQKSSNIDTDAEKVVTGTAVKNFVEGKNYVDNNLSNLTDAGKEKITGLIDVTSSDITVSSSVDNDKKKTYLLKLEESKIKELAGTTNLASEYAKVDASNIQDSTWRNTLKVYNKQEVDDKLNGEITSSETKMVSGKKVFDSISSSRTNITVDTSQDMLTITGGSENGISGKNYTLGIDKTKLSEYIKSLTPNAKLKFKGDETGSVEYSVGLDEIANFKGNEDIKVKSDASGVSVTLQKSSNIDADANKVVTGQAVKSFVEGKNYTDSNLSNLTETGKEKITGLIDVISSDITVSSSVDNNKKKTYELKLKPELTGIDSIKKDNSKISFKDKEIDIEVNGKIFKFGETTLDLGSKQITNLLSGITDKNTVENVLSGNGMDNIKSNAVNVQDLSNVAKAVIDKGILFKGNKENAASETIKLGDTITIDSSTSTNGKDINASISNKTLTLELNKSDDVSENDERVVTSKAVATAIKNVNNQLTGATITYKSNGANTKNVKLSDGLNFVKYNDNIDVEIDENGVIKHKLANQLKEVESISATSDEKGAKITLSTSDKNVSFNEAKIKDILDGKIANDSKEAISGKQLSELVSKLGINVDNNNQFGQVSFAKIKGDSTSTDVTSYNTYKDAINGLITAVNNGIKLRGNDNKDVTVNLNGTVKIVGKDTNVKVAKKESSEDTLEIDLSKNLTGIESIENGKAKIEINEGEINLTTSTGKTVKFKENEITGVNKITANENYLDLANGVLSVGGHELSFTKVDNQKQEKLIRISNVADPNSDNDAVNKKYVDNRGIKFKGNKLEDGKAQEELVTLDKTLKIDSSDITTSVTKNNDEVSLNLTLNKSDVVSENDERVVTSKAVATAIKSVNNQLKGATITYKANGTNAKNVKLSDGLNFVKYNDNIDVEIDDDGTIKHKLANHLKEVESISATSDEKGAKITLSTSDKNVSFNEAKIKDILDGKIANDSKEAINGSQLYSLNTHLGLKLNDTNSKILAPTFVKLKDHTTGNDVAENTPITITEAIGKNIAALNRGIKYSADLLDDNSKNKIHYLGSTVSFVKLGSELGEYNGNNLITQYTYGNDGNAKIEIGLKKIPTFEKVIISGEQTYAKVQNNEVVTKKYLEEALDNFKIKVKANGKDEFQIGRGESINFENGLNIKVAAESKENLSSKPTEVTQNVSVEKQTKEPTINISTEKNLTGLESVTFEKNKGVISGLKAPENDSEAVNKKYVDDKLKATNLSVTNNKDGVGLKLTKKGQIDNVSSGLGISEDDYKDNELHKKYPNENFEKKLGIDDDKVKYKVMGLLDKKYEDKSLDKVATVRDLQAVAKTGVSFYGNDDKKVHTEISNYMKIIGEGTTVEESQNFDSASGNINVRLYIEDTKKEKSDSPKIPKLEIQLREELQKMKSFETKENSSGQKIKLEQDKIELTRKGQSIIKIDGAKGEIIIPEITEKTNPMAAVNKKYVDNLGSELNSGIASAVAMANLPQMSSGMYEHNIAVAIGQHKQGVAMALGVSGTNEEGNLTYRASASIDNKATFSFGAGIGYQIGKPIKNSDKAKIKELENKNKILSDRLDKIEKQNEILIKKIEELIKK